jgi:hypothetical protein
MIVVAFLGCGVVMVCSLILMVEVSWFFFERRHACHYFEKLYAPPP